MPISRVGLDWLCCIIFIECWMKTYLFHLKTFHMVSIGFILYFFTINFEWSLSFNLNHNLVELSSFISKCNDDILIVHFLINYVLLPFTSFLFIIISFTHNMCLFVCYLRKRSWIVYTNCALCLGLMFPLDLLFTGTLLDHLHRLCTSLFATFGSTIRSSTQIVHCVCER
jgi:hypothetical protein